MWKTLVAALVGIMLLHTTVASAQLDGGRLPTRWDKDISVDHPLPEYPRPQMTRPRWQNLNGPWQLTLTDSAAATRPAAFDQKILVPYPYESALSGIGKESPVNQRLWYRRTFSVPGDWRTNSQRVLIHFGAVNWASTISLNGKPVGEHKGGFDGFEFDLTDALQPGENELVVSAWNPMPVNVADAQVVGKQRLHHDGIFYTGSTGIWQTVWIEPTPQTRIRRLAIVPDIDAKTVHVTAYSLPDAGSPIEITALDGTTPVAKASGLAGNEIILPIADPKLWSPADPHLYALHVTLGDDAVDSYFAMRKISLGKDDHGVTRILLNNQFVFQVGALDQGYWPDGIYTAPTDDALKFDIESAKSFGLNLLRKHAKVEPDRWYYWADRLGILVWQDMPQCFSGKGGVLSDATKTQWLVEWKAILAQLQNHPAIVVWTTFNENWGQHDTEAIVALTQQIDPSRLVNNASGWVDKNVGDLRDTHAYPGPWCEMPEDKRAVVNGEFGGVTARIDGHMWTTKVVGYGSTLGSQWKITQKYQELLKKAYGLRDSRGCSAVVYTQLTDVEQESNGLMTYDRAVIKPLAEIMTAANKGEFLPLPPKPPSTQLVPTSQEDPQTWSYTVDKPADDWMTPAFDASAWKSAGAPFGQGYPVTTKWATPDIWIRRIITLPETIPDKLMLLTLHDEDVEIYLNGVLAASAKGFDGQYVALPMSDAARATLKPGANVLAAHCLQTVGGQAIDVGIVAGK